MPPLLLLPITVSARPLHPRCRAGEAIELQVEINNASFATLPAVSLSAVDASDATIAPGPTGPLSPGRSNERLHMHCTRRGVYSLEQLQFSTSFPFGLAEAKRPVASNHHVTVWPQPILPKVSLMLYAAAAPTIDSAASRFSGEGDLAGVRAYRRGDSMRIIHWQQTARHDRLIVRERAEHSQKTCRLSIDLRQEVYDGPAQFEQAVSMAAGVIERVIEQGRREQIAIDLRVDRRSVLITNEASEIAALDLLANVTVTPNAQTSAEQMGLIVTTRRGWATIGSGRAGPVIVKVSMTEQTA
ncbi:MAG TPA: DUF58 domain-containing protein [Tepidisphaeraceae bacterium]